MRLVLDTCVLYPTVMRECLLGAAVLGHFVPVWSDRILEEWRRAAARHGAEQALQGEGEIALVRAAWPNAVALPDLGLETRLWLPDPADIHVLASAIASSADGIVTVNAKDFPRNMLSEEGLFRIDPDTLLVDFWQRDPDGLAALGDRILEQANAMDSKTWDIRALLKKARLPRLAKVLSSQGDQRV